MTLPRRKPNRLQNYDYASVGGYFITICTDQKRKLFWSENVGADRIRPRDEVSLSKYGRCVQTAIEAIPERYPQYSLLKYCIMPNHVHLMLLCEESCGGRTTSVPTISTVVGQMKRAASKAAGIPLWQKSFHDRVIRNEKEYLKIWKYIDENPLKWELDCFYTEDESLSVSEQPAGG